MASCDYCRYQDTGFDGLGNMCKKDIKVKITPEGVKEEWYMHDSCREALKHFRKHNGGVCPHYSSFAMHAWWWLMGIGVSVIALVALKKLL